MSCFSSGPVVFPSLWLLRILFLKLPVVQGSVLGTGYRDAEGTVPRAVSQSVTRTGETKPSYEFTGDCPGNLWTWVPAIALPLSWASSSLLQAQFPLV